ncbi:MAG: acetate--CoA ligase family protein [Pseudomonadota bacterium]
MTRNPSLDPLYRPNGVAVIGASNKPLSIGHRVVTNLLENGYKGAVYPVHPKETEVLGLTAYPSVLDIPGQVDLVNICIRNIFVPQAVEECGRKGVKFVIIHTGGFREAGGDGTILEDRVMETARKYGVRVYGPNSQGVMNSDPAVSLYANFTFTPMKPGGVSILAQSGGVAEVLNLNLRERGVGFSLYASNGNARDVSIPEILEYFGQDEATRVIMLHVESMQNPREFIEVVSRITPHKPVLAVKSGKTAEASKAISSHTGSLMEADTLSDAIFEAAGVIRYHAMQEMVDAAVAFATQPLPEGPRVGFITNAGGPGIIAVDECVGRGLRLAALTPQTCEKLVAGLPPEGHAENPVDTAATAGPPHFAAATGALLADPNVDAVLVNMVTPFFVDSPGNAAAIVEEWTASGKKKPLVVVAMTNEHWASTVDTIKDAGIPTYAFPETAAKVLHDLVRYRRIQASASDEPETVTGDRERALGILEEARAAGGGFLPARRAFEILRCYGIPFPEYRSVRDEAALRTAATDLGFPLVLKVESEAVVHRTDEGGVLLGIADEAALLEGFRALMTRFARHDPFVTVQQQLPGGREVIIGAKREGGLPLVMAGLGGIHVEVFKDVAFRLAPFSRARAEEMFRSLRGFPLLEGVRGQAPADLPALVDIVLRVQQLVSDLDPILELDLNPVLAYEENAFVVDVRAKV